MKQGWSLLRIGPLLLAISIGVAAAPQDSRNSPPPGSSTRTGSPAMSADTPQPALSVVAPAAAARASRPSWIPSGIDDVPAVKAGVECPVPQVVGGAGQRITELIDNLQKFDATERVEHFNVNGAGSRGKPETRTFDYTVTITPSRSGVFYLEEYRNGTIDPLQFPAQIATVGLSSMALMLHPILITDFKLACEGLGQLDGHPAWQIHFEQRADRPNRILSYALGKQVYPVPLIGRVWVDATTYQVRRFESELLDPVEKIGLTQQYIAIDYGPVQFQAHKLELWLPLDANVYWERRGRRYYRRHSFSNFKLFGVDASQHIKAPEESYCFKNTSDNDISGILTVTPVSGISANAISIQVTIPSGHRVCKLVGLGKDVNISGDDVASAAFLYNGLVGSLIAEGNLVNASTLDLIPETRVAPPAPK
jgi:hypothetical protein